MSEEIIIVRVGVGLDRGLVTRRFTADGADVNNLDDGRVVIDFVNGRDDEGPVNAYHASLMYEVYRRPASVD